MKSSGLSMTLFMYSRVVLNRIFNLLIVRNDHLRLDYTSKIQGLKNVVAYGKVSAGRYFWLATYEKHTAPQHTPHIVFKGDFNASDFCHIGATHFIEIGNNVLFGSKVYVTDHGHGQYSGENKHSSPYEPPIKRCLDTNKTVIIGDNVWIGDNVAVLPGVHIGKGCIIGANAVVTKNIPEFCIAVGIPAKVIKKYDFEKEEWVPYEGR